MPMPDTWTSKGRDVIAASQARVRRFLTPLVRSYIRNFPLVGGKHAFWTRVVAPYFAWHSYKFVASTVFGKQLAGDTIEMLQQYIYFFGVWEPDLTRWITRRLAPGDTFIDVGANIGYYSVLASMLVGDAGQVVAIEASPEIFRALQSNLARNSVKNVRAANLAVSDCKRALKLFRGHVYNTGLTTVVEEQGFEFECEVDAAPLSTILRPEEMQTARLIKIDVEGAEFSVVDGMLPLLCSGRADLEIIIEVHPEHLAQLGKRPEDFLTIFSDAGFHAYLLENNYSPLHYLSSKVENRPVRIRSSSFVSPLSIGTLLVFSREDSEAI
jgi:FkbM family methyltransferase